MFQCWASVEVGGPILRLLGTIIYNRPIEKHSAGSSRCIHYEGIVVGVEHCPPSADLGPQIHSDFSGADVGLPEDNSSQSSHTFVSWFD